MINGWEKLDAMPEGVVGTLVAGDPEAPPTRWWNHWYLLFRGWKTIVTFGVNVESVDNWPYRVGYKDFNGNVMLCDHEHSAPRFTALIGREGCRFFALNEDGHEVPLRLLQRKPRKNYNFADDGDFI